MTKPPCKSGGTDCPCRTVCCQSTCEAFKEWLKIHEAEKEAERRAKDMNKDFYAFQVDGERRRRNGSQAIYIAKKKR